MKKIISKKILMSLLITILIGFLFGLIFIFLISKIDKLSINHELNEYIELIINNEYSIKKGIINTSISLFLTYFLIFISSIVFILLPLCFFMNFYKSFSLGFMISSFIYTFKSKAFIYLVSITFFELISIGITILFSMFSIKYSKKFYSYFKNSENINIKENVKRYVLIFIIFLISGIIWNIINIFLNLYLTKLIY